MISPHLLSHFFKKNTAPLQRQPRDLLKNSWRSCRRKLFCGAGAVIIGTTGVSWGMPPTPQNTNIVDLGNVGGSVAGFRISGDEGLSGLSVSGAGDVNGDGAADVIVGALTASLGEAEGAGESYVIFGKSDFAPVLLSEFGEIETSYGYSIFGAAELDQSGRSVSGVGDANGDGFSDVIIGAPGQPGSTTNPGRAFLVFGKPTLESVSLDSINSQETSYGFEILGVDPGDSHGFSVSGAGDVNGDGLYDVITGASSASPNGRNDAGESYVVFGKSGDDFIQASNLGSNGNNEGFRIQGGTPGDISGFSVAGAGDINGDGLGDLVVGAYNADPQGRNNAGEIFVVFGKEAGNTIDLANFDNLGNSDGFLIEGGFGDLEAGHSVSGAGDVNGDGFGDIIIGAPDIFENDGCPGDSFVVFGKQDTDTIDLVGFGSQETAYGFRILGEFTASQAGRAVSGGGDVNGDGLADLFIGAQNAPNGGRGYVVYGKSDGANVDLNNLDETTNNQGFVLDAENNGDNLGRSVSHAGDVNVDGISDLLIGAFGASPGGISNAGESYVVFGPGRPVTIPESATYRSWAAPGRAHPIGVGVSGDGSDFDSPTSRCWIGFFGPDDSGGPGTNGASLQTVTLTRNNNQIRNLGTGNNSNVANVMWRVETNRTDYWTAWMKFRYTPAEVQGLDPQRFAVFQAPTPTGPWSLCASQEHQIEKRRIIVDIPEFAAGDQYFAILEQTNEQLEARAIIDCLLGLRPIEARFDVNTDQKINVADVVQMVLSSKE